MLESRLTELPSIRGKITFIDGRQLIYAYPRAWQRVNNEWVLVSTPQTSANPSTGEYQLRLPDAGTYRIEAFGSLWPDAYFSNQNLSRFYGGDDLASAEDIVIRLNEERRDVNIVLGEDDFAAKISGLVTNDSGKALSNIRVELFQNSGYSPPFLFTITNVSGNFSFTDLINGAYFLRYSDPSAQYATMFHQGQAGPSRANQIQTTGNSPATLTATMQLAGKIEGSLRNDEGQPFSQAAVVLYTVDQSSNQVVDNPATTRTNTNGEFHFHGVMAGTYQLRFDHVGLPQNQSVSYGQFDFEIDRYIPSNIIVTPTKVSRADMVVIKFDTVYLPIVAK